MATSQEKKKYEGAVTGQVVRLRGDIKMDPREAQIIVRDALRTHGGVTDPFNFDLDEIGVLVEPSKEGGREEELVLEVVEDLYRAISSAARDYNIAERERSGGRVVDLTMRDRAPKRIIAERIEAGFKCKLVRVEGGYMSRTVRVNIRWVKAITTKRPKKRASVSGKVVEDQLMRDGDTGSRLVARESNDVPMPWREGAGRGPRPVRGGVGRFFGRPGCMAR